jgi:ABC-type Fe3+/spermidine/putrescine transport system ATPase subunit
MQPLIEARNLVKKFGDFIAVDGIDLAIREGEFLTLLGSSGSGKTTVLRLIAGLEEPSSGQINYRGEDISRVPTRRREMRMVFQDYALFPHLSVYDNIAFGLRLNATKAKYGAERVKALVAEYLEFVHLRGQERKLPHQLSGGQKQRVALARALVTDPPVVLFDEPLGSLDASLRKEMQFELKRIHQQLNKTFVYVTHDQEEALAMSDRIAVMKDSKILQVDTPEKLYNEPDNSAVARFLGAANILTGRIARRDGATATVACAAGQLVIADGGSGVSPGDRVSIVLRSESIDFAPAGAAPSAAGLHGVVAARLFLGKSIEYQVQLDGGQGVLTATLSRAATLHAIGDRVLATARGGSARVLAEAELAE